MKGFWFAVLLFSWGTFCFGKPPAHKSTLGKEIFPFTLKNVDGKAISLSDYPTAKGFIVLFICNHCPFAKLYTERLNSLAMKYKAQGVPLLAINSMDTVVYDSELFGKMKERAKQEHFQFPYLQDATQQVGRAFDAQRTPQAYILWRENNKWRIKYSGAIDNNGQDPSIATPYIADAVQQLLSGKPVQIPETEAVGCNIYYRK